MTSGGQKPALGFTHRRDALLLLMTLQQCTSRTKPRFFKTFVCPKPQSAATILGFCVEKRTKTSLELARHNKPRFTKGTPRAWGESLQSVGRFAPPETAKWGEAPHAGCCREAATHCTPSPLSGRRNRCEELQPPARELRLMPVPWRSNLGVRGRAPGRKPALQPTSSAEDPDPCKNATHRIPFWLPFVWGMQRAVSRRNIREMLGL
jgi:hypothetical protein